jgi:hypothetical protein
MKTKNRLTLLLSALATLHPVQSEFSPKQGGRWRRAEDTVMQHVIWLMVMFGLLAAFPAMGQSGADDWGALTWNAEAGEWQLAELSLAPAPAERSEAAYVFAAEEPAVGALAFTISAGAGLDLELAERAVFSLVHEGEALALYWLVEDAWLGRQWPLPKAGMPLTIQFDLDGWRLVLPWRSWPLPDVLPVGERAQLRSLLLANHDQANDLLLRGLAITPATAVAALAGEETGGITESTGAEAESPSAPYVVEWVEHPYLGRIPISPPPPHPYLVMDENGFLLGVSQEGASLHRRPHMVPEPVLRRWIEKAREQTLQTPPEQE